MIRSEGKNVGRLQFVCAAHHLRFGEWPTYSRMEPIILWDLMISIGEEQFCSLAWIDEMLRARRRTSGYAAGFGIA